MAKLPIMLAALLAVCLLPAAASAKAKPRYYLSLGDSLAAGYQKAPDGSNAFTPNKYANLLHQRAKKRFSNLKLVNYGCPGESTTSFINGGCPFPISDAQKTTPQMKRTLNFLKKNRKRTAFITISIGANNFTPCSKGTAIDIACVGNGQLKLGDELPRILKELRKKAGKRVKIAVLAPYNPYLALYLLGADYRGLALTTDSLAQTVRDTIALAAKNAKVAVANGYTAFQSGNLEQTTTLNGQTVPVAVAEVCRLTLMCAPAPQGPDIHPTDAGYRLLYSAFRKALKL